MSSVELANRPSARRGRARASCAGLILVGIAGGCASGTSLSQRIDRVAAAVVAAETRGSMRCAPRELAVARSHLEFARLEEEQGFPSRARQHLDVAEENVEAAGALSPPGRCTNDAR